MVFKYNYFRFLIFLLLGYHGLFAQTTANFSINLNLSEVALLDVEPQNSTLNFNFLPPSESGNKITTPTVNTTCWLNYTSAKKTSSPNRNITARVDQIIPGVLIKMQASASSGVGTGALGTPSGKVTLTTNPIIIISGIGGGFTGNGINNGHQLNISLEINDYKELVKVTNKVITITYTISN